MRRPRFTVRPMTEADAEAVAAWRYPGDYSFYDVGEDPEDLAALSDPTGWGVSCLAADYGAVRLAGFFELRVSGGIAETGLGLRPELTGRALGQPFVRAGMAFAEQALGAQGHRLVVAAFNRRAITVYERAGFCEVERYEHSTRGERHPFVRMSRGPLANA